MWRVTGVSIQAKPYGKIYQQKDQLLRVNGESRWESSGILQTEVVSQYFEILLVEFSSRIPSLSAQQSDQSLADFLGMCDR